MHVENMHTYGTTFSAAFYLNQWVRAHKEKQWNSENQYPTYMTTENCLKATQKVEQQLNNGTSDKYNTMQPDFGDSNNNKIITFIFNVHNMI